MDEKKSDKYKDEKTGSMADQEKSSGQPPLSLPISNISLIAEIVLGKYSFGHLLYTLVIRDWILLLR